MKIALVSCAFVAFTFWSSVASATCVPKESMFADMIGNPGWLVLNERQLLSYNLSDAPKIVIPALEQTGPEKWSPMEGKVFPQGTPGTVTGAIYRETYIDYFKFRLQSGEEVVVDSANVQEFDFRECDGATLLYDRAEVSRPLGKVDGIPMLPRQGARPVEFSGDWVAERYLGDIVYVNCYSYEAGVLGSDKFYLECSPVWKEGVSPTDYGTPLRMYYENADLTQILIPPSNTP